MAIITYLGEGTGFALLLGAMVLILGGLAFLLLRSPKKEYVGRILFAVFFMELAAVCMVLVLNFRQGGGGEVGPRVVPILWLAGISGLSVLLLIRALTGVEEKDPPWGKVGKVAVFIGLTVLYLVLMQYLGYYLTTVLYVVVSMYYLGYRKWKVMASVAATWVVVAYLAFFRLLYVPLPSGLLIDWIFG